MTKIDKWKRRGKDNT